MQRLAEVCIRRPVFAIMLITTLVAAGLIGHQNLAVDRFPPVDLPTVFIRTALPGASPEEVEVEVSQPLEGAINSIEGLDELRSISAAGTSIVLATFKLERDIDAATQDVRDRVASVLRSLPRDAELPVVSKSDSDSSPVLTLAVFGPRTLRELTEIADRQVRRFLERAKGVGEVRLVGGLERTINLWLEADRLAAYGLPIAAVRDAIARQNSAVPGGLITEPDRERSLRTLGRIIEPGGFQDLVIARLGETPVRIRDVGVAEDGTGEPRSSARLDGVPTVTLEVRRQSGANTLAVIDAVTERLALAALGLPADVGVQVISDQSRYIRAAQHEIHLHLVLGALLASLVVLLFLRSVRSTLIAAVAIPASVITTFGVMWVLGFTLNSVTMLALVLMVGVVIDDAIVVLENVFRFVEEKGTPPRQAAAQATAEIGLAVLATTLSLVVIFVPVSFMSSISGRFLLQFGLTAAAAVMVSLLVSFTLTPMMCARLLRASDAAAAGGLVRSRQGLYGWLERGYLAALGWSLRWRWLTLVIALGVAATTVPLYGLVKQDYIPSDVDEGEFEINVTAPEGTSLGAMTEAMLAVEASVRRHPMVQHALVTTGGGFLDDVNRGRVYVVLEPQAERTFGLARLLRATLALDPAAAWRGNQSQREVMLDLRAALRAVAGLRFSVRNNRSINLGGGNFDLDFVLCGPDLPSLAAWGERIRTTAEQLGGLVDLDTTLRLDKPELRVTIDRQRAADLGVEAEDIATTLRLLVGGDREVSRYRDPDVDELYDVRLRLREADRNDPARIAQLLVPGRGAVPIRLDNVASIAPALAPSRIDRLDRERQVSLRGSIAPGFALGDRVNALRAAVHQLNLPAEYHTLVSGRARELERTFDEFAFAFLMSLLFMYMVLAAQLESFVHPLTILCSLPVTVPFALASLAITGDTLNLYSALGILVLVGVVKKNGILQVDHTNLLRAQGLPRFEAVMRANRDRLRPILMTTLAFVAGMVPLAVGTGPGAEERRAIAVVVIGGQLLALLLTLLITPVVYTLLDDLRGRRAR